MEKTEKEIDMTAEVRRLAKMTVPELRDRHQEHFGEEPRSRHRELLARQIAWRLQAEREGGLPEETRQYALAIARHAPLRIRIEDAATRREDHPAADKTATTRLASVHDSRLPMPGSLLMKQYKGETHVVKVLDSGFEYGGRLHGSLSAIAQEITGTKWNGFLFFGIAKEGAHGRR